MNLSPLPIQKFFDNNGTPMAGGLLFTYVSGTSTKLATYKDQAGTLNSNPIVLDFRGEANVWLDQTLTYKFVLAPVGDTDPPTKPIWTVNNISAAVTYASLTQQILGQIIYPRTAAEIAAAITPTSYIYPPGNVLRYGADPTGSADSSTATIAAIASWNGRGVVTFPAGVYKVSAAIAVTPNGILFVGAGCSQINAIGVASRGATCILRAFVGASPTVLFAGDDCGSDGIDYDNNAQGTGECVQFTGGRFIMGMISTRNSGGNNLRGGKTNAGASDTNTNCWYAAHVMTAGAARHGWLLDDQNTTTSPSYPLGSANLNSGYCALVDARGNGTNHTITNVTQAASGVVTVSTASATNPFAVGDAVGFASITGMVQLNSATTLQACNVTAIGGVSGAWTFTINVNTTGYGAYAGGGTAGLGGGVEVWNANDNIFAMLHAEGNLGPGFRAKSDGTNVVARCNHVLCNDSEGNVAPDIQIDGGTLPAAAPGGYTMIFGNRSVAVEPRIVDNSSGSLVIKWVPGLNKRSYCFGEDINVINPAAGGAAGYNMSVGANASPVRLFGVAVGATDSLMRAAVRKVGVGLTVGWEVNEYAVFKPKNNLFTVTYSASMTIDDPTGNSFQITANNGAPFTINAPTNPGIGAPVRIQIRNTSGGALGLATWNAVFKMPLWVQPANGFSRWVEFEYNGANWVESFRSAADVPN
jgi:hypothetical protein